MFYYKKKILFSPELLFGSIDKIVFDMYIHYYENNSRARAS